MQMLLSKCVHEYNRNNIDRLFKSQYIMNMPAILYLQTYAHVLLKRTISFDFEFRSECEQ